MSLTVPVEMRDPRAALTRRRLRAPETAHPGGSLADGDPLAIAVLQRDYGSLALAYVRSILRDEHEAEDVMQSVWVEVWRRAPKYDSTRSSVRSWLLMIARSRALDQLRRRVPEPLDPAAGSLIEIAEPHEPVEQMLETWRVADLLRRLPASEAHLLRLRFYEELSQTEIADRLELPLGTVKTNMSRALRRLRDLLAEEPL